jgi:mannose/fructose/N-acetylgalactosamine-specific phosphotransferase system component IIB
MTPEQAKARTRALLNVIETVYELKIVNLEEIINVITEQTLDANKILTICTGLNTWVALNAALGGVVEIPREVVNGLAEKIVNV